MSSPKKHPYWNHAFFILEVGCLPLAFWWIPYSHLPPPGWAVAFIAGAAAAMSVHDDMKGWQKALWMLIIGVFLITETRAINKDRAIIEAQALQDRNDQNAAFKAVRDKQDKDFSATAQGLSDAIGGIQSTLSTANTTLRQTQPHADLQIETFQVLDTPAPPKLFNSEDTYHVNIKFSNDGAELGKVSHRMFRVYVDKPDDLQAQLNIEKKFDAAWNQDKPAYSPWIAPAHLPGFWSDVSKFSKEDEDNLLHHGNTVYFLARMVYRDSTGAWEIDRCDDSPVGQQPNKHAGVASL